jgi:hypothetical protein
MGGKLRRRELIPEDTPIKAMITEPKVVHGQYGRQVEAKIVVNRGDYKGTTFKSWFSFSRDNDGEEFISYGAPLYQLLALVEPKIDEVLDDDDLTERKYQAFVKGAVKKLAEFEIMGRVGVKVPKNNPEKKSNILQPGSFGPAQDPDEAFADIDLTHEPLF